MAIHHESNMAEPEHGVSRRLFLGVTASVAGKAFLGKACAADPPPRRPISLGATPSRVVQIRNRGVVNGPEVHRGVLAELIDQALIALTKKPNPRAAWHALLDPEDIVGFKFNRSGQRVISTSDAVVDTLVTSLVTAGWSRDRIVLIEAPPRAAKRNGTTPAVVGYDVEETHFGSGSDQLAAVLRQITALIDVPFVKSHNICGLTCALKNLSHGLTKHPARYHDNGCSPYIADIVASPPIRTRLRLCLVDALRVVYAGGPKATAETISDEGLILASLDPVAVDTLGLAILNDIHRRHNLDLIARSSEEIGYLPAAQHRGLGTSMWRGIELVRLST